MQVQNQQEAEPLPQGEARTYKSNLLSITFSGERWIRYVSGGTCLKCLSPLGKSSTSLGKSVSDLWRGKASCKSLDV